VQTYDRRIQDVLDAAESLFALNGFHATSMRDIAAAAGISVAGLYYYLPSKQSALYLVCSRIFDRLDASAAEISTIPGPQERLLAFVREHLGYMLRNHAAYRVLLHDMDAVDEEFGDRLRDRKRRYFNIASDLISALSGSYAIVSPRLAAGALFGMLNWAPSWYRRGLDGDIDALAAKILTLFLGGISAPPSPAGARS